MKKRLLMIIRMELRENSVGCLAAVTLIGMSLSKIKAKTYSLRSIQGHNVMMTIDKISASEQNLHRPKEKLENRY